MGEILVAFILFFAAIKLTKGIFKIAGWLLVFILICTIISRI